MAIYLIDWAVEMQTWKWLMLTWTSCRLKSHDIGILSGRNSVLEPYTLNCETYQGLHKPMAEIWKLSLLVSYVAMFTKCFVWLIEPLSKCADFEICCICNRECQFVLVRTETKWLQRPNWRRSCLSYFCTDDMWQCIEPDITCVWLSHN
jgi:hypothetical protein